jgi:flagellar protein FliO/FliZ
MAQPMIAAPEPVAAPLAGDTVLYPEGTTPGGTPATRPSSAPSSGSWIFILLSGCAGAGFWLWLRKRRLPEQGRRCIQIEDTRPLGNRQFLVVASCDGKRFLLGVATGGIQLLAPLDSKDDSAASRHA